MKTVGVIDYKAGNAPSVCNALLSQGLSATLITQKAQLKEVSAIILPGVGSAAATMESLREMDLQETLHERVNRAGVPFLGICVGLQILFDHSEEGDTPCLGWLHGKVKRFPEGAVRIPQMGWNQVTFKEGQAPGYYYFVNSYYAEPEDESITAATAEYGLTFCAMVKQNNIAATQFHLEKSGSAGLALLRTLVE